MRLILGCTVLSLSSFVIDFTNCLSLYFRISTELVPCMINRTLLSFRRARGTDDEAWVRSVLIDFHSFVS